MMNGECIALAHVSGQIKEGCPQWAIPGQSHLSLSEQPFNVQQAAETRW